MNAMPANSKNQRRTPRATRSRWNASSHPVIRVSRGPLNRTAAAPFHRRAFSAVIVATVTPMMLGFTALAVDVGLMNALEAETQSAVDMAALAGATGLVNLDLSAAQSRATQY